MNLVHERLYVGAEVDCRKAQEGWAVIHACKSPCHQTAVGYRGSLDKSHANYLILEKDRDLYMNLIDPPVPLFKLESFRHFLEFGSRHWSEGMNILIHCNKGESRAPSLALLLLAKRLGVIDAQSYDDARTQFVEAFHGYSPGQGICTFLQDHWGEL